MGMGAVFGAVGTLLGRLSAARAAYLDKLDLGGSYKVASEEHWSDTRAGYLDKINSQFPAGGKVISSSEEVAKAAVWSQELATALAALKKFPSLKPIVKGQTGALADVSIVSISYAAPGSDVAFWPYVGSHISLPINADGAQGFRYKYKAIAQGGSYVGNTYYEVMNETNIKGYLYGASCIGCETQYIYPIMSIRITIDGNLVYESSDNYSAGSTSSRPVIIPIGNTGTIGTYTLPILAQIPMRFESSLKVEIKSHNPSIPANCTATHGIAVYLLD